jgi:hypothetical protein
MSMGVVLRSRRLRWGIGAVLEAGDQDVELVEQALQPALLQLDREHDRRHGRRRAGGLGLARHAGIPLSGSVDRSTR